MTTIELNDSCTINIPLSEPSSIEAFFLFGLHKCGSSLLNKIFVDICRAKQIPYISIPEIAFKQGIATNVWNGNKALNKMILDGYCLRGFRHYPKFLETNNIVNQRKKILLVRDPRDALVSAYFSFANSHRLPESGQLLADMQKSREALKNIDVERYVLANAPKVREAFNRYHDHLSNDFLLKTYRYEDIIFDKYNWITDMLDFLELPIAKSKISEIANKHNIVPSSEDINRHVRKVKPGDHRDKLSPECISQTNEILAEILARYKYEH